MRPALPAITVIALLLGACQPSQPAPAPSSGGEAMPATNAAPTMPDIVSATFRCGDLLLGTVFDNAVGKVTLSLSGHRLTLPRAISASGARYADAAGNEFWNKGDDATLTLAGSTAQPCSTTNEVSPWDAARERGAAFRGIGNEPGWSVEIDDRGEAPSLRAWLDYGARSIDVTQLIANDDGHRFSGTSRDGIAVVLEIDDTRCSDDMSEQSHPATALLTVGDRNYHGCGAWLDR